MNGIVELADYNIKSSKASEGSQSENKENGTDRQTSKPDNEILILRENSNQQLNQKEARARWKKSSKKMIKTITEGVKRMKTLNTINQTENEMKKIEEEFSVKKSFRQLLDSCLTTNKRKENIKALICLISLFSSVFYIACTYYTEMFLYLNYFDYAVCFIYFLEYLINFSLAHHRMNFVLSTDSLLDLVTLSPPLLSLYAFEINSVTLINLINASRVLRIMRFFRIFTISKSGENDVIKQIWMIINTLIMLVLICSGIIQIVEKDEVERRISLTTDQFDLDLLYMRTKFHHYIYFIVVTISTVGYGDIVPYTILGKIIVMGLILFTLVLIPKQTNDLIQLMGAQSEYARKKYTASQDVPHIVLIGDISLDSLKSFCQELFHPDHGTQYRHAVIIQSSLPSRELELFLNEKGNDNRIFYLEGDPMNEKDLLRADICKARACVIFNNKNSQDSYSSDHQNLLLGLYIKKFVYNTSQDLSEDVAIKDQSIMEGPSISNVNSHFRLCVQLIKPESKYHYFNALQSIYKKHMPPDQLILIDEIKMNLLSKSCITPGILALISNLVMSAGPLPIGTSSEWLEEYSEGRGHEIYRIQLSDYYKNYNFLDLVKEVYSQAQAIVFALEFEVDRITVIKLSPSSPLTIANIISNLNNNKDSRNNSKSSFSEEYFIEKYSDAKVKVFAYIICADKSEADSIANKDKQEERKKTLINSNMSISVAPFENKRKSRFLLPIHIDKESDEDSQNSDNENNNFLNAAVGDDFEINIDDYYINSKVGNEYIIENNIELMQHTIKDSEEIKHHVIVCGLHSALIHFILPLRAKYLSQDNLKFIVILAPHLPQSLYDSLSRFPKIIFIQGSPLLPENLYRANIMNADKAVILSQGFKIEKPEKLKIDLNSDQEDSESDIQMLDAESIFIYKAIKKCNKNIQIMTELISTTNVEYLLQKSYINSEFFKKEYVPLYEFTPLFAAGEVFTPSIIDRITCQSYYSPHILIILDQILNGGTRGRNRRVRKLEDDLKLLGSNLWLARVPDALINETFEELFIHLIKSHKIVAIALYRKNLIEDTYYVYTNPSKTTLINDMDLVFVLGNSDNINDLLDERDDDEFVQTKRDLNTYLKKKFRFDKLDDMTDESGSNLGSRGRAREKNRKGSSTTIDKNHTGISTSVGHLTKTDKISILTEDAKKNMKRRVSLANFRTVNKLGMTAGEEQKKESNSSKYLEIEGIKKRLAKVQSEISKLKEAYNSLPNVVEHIVDIEIENELKSYLERESDVSN